MKDIQMRHDTLHFFDKNGEYLNWLYEGLIPLYEKPFDWDSNKVSYYKKNANGEYVSCDKTDVWIELDENDLYSYYEKADRWVGELYLDDVSTDLFSVGQILIVERDKNGNYRLPFKKQVVEDDKVYDISNWVVETEGDDPSIFLFSYDKNYINYTQTALSQEPLGPDMERADSLSFELSDEDDIRKEAVVVNLAICSSDENTFKKTLYIYESNNIYEPVFDDIKENIVAIITVYGRTINEDERLKTICQNFGYNIIDTDSIAFEKTDVKEILPDWNIINEKRKEIILEGHNIYPYIGAYKGIINVIKYFGYNELQLREFWKNVNPDSNYYGKYIQTNCIEFIESNKVSKNTPKITIPSKQYRKTSMFSLVYKINDITQDKYDEDNLPLTHENQIYTQEEILIKLFALKRKLEKDFLPLNAKIKDIVGEADFFSLNELTNTVSTNIKNNIHVGIKPSFEVTNGEKYTELDETTYAGLTDLRKFLVKYYNSTTESVGEFPAEYYDTTQKMSDFINWLNLFVSPREKYSLIIDNEQVSLRSIMENGAGDDNFSVKKLIDVYLAYFKDYSPNIKHTGYWVEGRQPEYLGDVDPLPDGWKFITRLQTTDTKKYLPYSDFLNFEKIGNDSIPVGALLILKNTTFNEIIYDNTNKPLTNSIDITYNELSKGNKYDIITFGLENFLEYKSTEDNDIIYSEENDTLLLELNNIEIAKYVTTKTDTVSSIIKTVFSQCIEKKNTIYKDILSNIEFFINDDESELCVQGTDSYLLKWTIKHPVMPSEYSDVVESDMRYSVATSNRNGSSSSILTWDNIDKFDATGVEWTIKKDADNTSPAFYFNSYEAFNDRSIEKYNELPIILPYIGKYSVELKIFNTYNHVSSLIKNDCIEVVGREVEISGWYVTQEETNGFDNDLNDDDESSEHMLDYWESNAVIHRNNDYTWDSCGNYMFGEYGSSYENAIKPSTTWDDVTASLYEGLDNSNVIENNTLDIDDKNMHTSNFQPNGLHSNKGSYIWKNCKCSWDEAYHKSWDTTEETGDIPFYIEIDKTVLNTPGNIQTSGTETYFDKNGIQHTLEWSNPAIVFKFQHDFLVRNNIDPEEAGTFVYNINDNIDLVELYDLLKDFYAEYVDIEKFITKNFVYEADEYVEDYDVIVSDKKLYLESTTKASEYRYYTIDGNIISESDVHDDDSYPVNYLKQVADVEFYKNGDSYTATLDTIVRNGEDIPVVNIYKLEHVQTPVYIEKNVIHTPNGLIEYGESSRVIPNTDMENVPDELIHDNIVDTDSYTDALVPWKYYKHLVGFEKDKNTEPIKWYYTYINPLTQVSSVFADRTIPTRNPIDGIEYIETDDKNEIMDNNNYTKSYCYNQFIETPIYEYYMPVPCTKYVVLPYIKYTYKPDINPEHPVQADPIKLQISGKYLSQLCDIFDVSLCFVVAEDGVQDDPGIYRDFGLSDTGIVQHNTEIHNPTWNNVNFINSWKKLPKLTRICFTYDKCKILGKRNPKWTIKNTTTGTEKIINSKYCTYMFVEPGDYSITLELYDSNKNKYIGTKNYLTIE